jgi:hypothetical protein
MMAKKRDERIPDAETLVSMIEKVQRKHKKRSIDPDFDLTGAMPVIDMAQRNRRSKQILVAMVLLGMVLFSTLEYVDIRIKAPTPRAASASTQTVLTSTPDQMPVIDQIQSQQTGPAAPQQQAPALDEVLNALIWLGDQSLKEFKLTYPPQDNAYYYYGRLLELDPGNQTAITGILEIAEQYAVLAEEAMIKNDIDKMTSYIDIGLKINPDNRSLISLKGFVEKNQSGFMSTLKSFFSN